MPYKDPEIRVAYHKKYAKDHPEVNRRATKSWRERNPERMKAIHLQDDSLRRYGLPRAVAEELRKQNCEICGVLAKKMCIDHSVPKTYRGVLCQQCNVRLGWFERLRDKIVTYTERTPIVCQP